eukprot:2205064-Pyramimonas_sp.AAC.1
MNEACAEGERRYTCRARRRTRGGGGWARGRGAAEVKVSHKGRRRSRRRRMTCKMTRRNKKHTWKAACRDPQALRKS